MEARFSAPFHTGPEARSASYTMDIGSLQGLKRRQLCVNHPPCIEPRLKKSRALTGYRVNSAHQMIVCPLFLIRNLPSEYGRATFMKMNADGVTTSAFLPRSSFPSTVLGIAAEVLTPWYRELLELWISLQLFNSNKSSTRCNNFPVYYPDFYLQLNMFRAFSRPSSGAQ